MKRMWVISGLLAGASLAGCAGKSSAPNGAEESHTGGGTGSQSGADAGSLASTGGTKADVSDAGGPARPAQGNLLLNVYYQDSSLCPVPNKTYVLGNPEGPSVTSPGDRLVDGDHGAKIKCSVHGSDPYMFSATIQATSSEGDPVTMTLTDGVVSADRQTGGTATISVSTPQLGGTFGGSGCVVKVVGAQVKTGSIWATFSCKTIYPVDLGVCSIGADSTFVLENCDAR